MLIFSHLMKLSINLHVLVNWYVIYAVIINLQMYVQVLSISRYINWFIFVVWKLENKVDLNHMWMLIIYTQKLFKWFFSKFFWSSLHQKNNLYIPVCGQHKEVVISAHSTARKIFYTNNSNTSRLLCLVFPLHISIKKVKPRSN